jgi:hypothetical protein
MDHELHEPVAVEFPLRGEGWLAETTPAARIPSHGTDLLGQRYAYDFIKVDRRRGAHFHPAGTMRQLFIGARTTDAYAWGAAIHAPFDAEVVRADDGLPERSWIHPVREAVRQVRNAATFTPSRLQAVLGNAVILRSGGVYAAFAHLAPGTVEVAVGQRVGTGDLIGRVGHTGNSTSPHLHFQLMDSAELMSARGIPCAFRSYEVERDGGWVPVTDGIPGRRDRIRSLER